jgi:hypothetical protein
MFLKDALAHLGPYKTLTKVWCSDPGGKKNCFLARHYTNLTGGAPLEAPGLVSFLGYAVSKSTGVNQTSPLDRHHPMETLETM